MSNQMILSYVTGVLFLAMMLGVGCYIAFRRNQQPIPVEAVFIFRVVLALAGAGFGAVLPGSIELEGTGPGWVVRAGGALAVAVLVYLINPPALAARRSRDSKTAGSKEEQGRPLSYSNNQVQNNRDCTVVIGERNNVETGSQAAAQERDA